MPATASIPRTDPEAIVGSAKCENSALLISLLLTKRDGRRNLRP